MRRYPLLPSIKFTPLISFDTILDLDTGLINLIKEEYADPDVFDIELLKLPEDVLISNLYFRPCENPLYTIRNRNMELNDDNKNILDDYYKEFMDTRYDDIVSLSNCTDMDELVLRFKEAKDITVAIVVNNDYEASHIKLIEKLSEIQIVYYSDIDDSNRYNQIYLKYISDLSKFPSTIRNTTFYFTDSGVNLGEKNRPREKYMSTLSELIKNANDFAVYNMYKESIISRNYLDYFKDIIKYNNTTED